MTDDFLVEFLVTILIGEGVADPIPIARKAACDLRKAKVVDQRRIETASLHHRIDTLSRQGVPTSTIAVRLNMHRVSVAKIVSDLHRNRKAG